MPMNQIEIVVDIDTSGGTTTLCPIKEATFIFTITFAHITDFNHSFTVAFLDELRLKVNKILPSHFRMVATL